MSHGFAVALPMYLWLTTKHHRTDVGQKLLYSLLKALC